jgi:hypothetical protein
MGVELDPPQKTIVLLKRNYHVTEKSDPLHVQGDAGHPS